MFVSRHQLWARTSTSRIGTNPNWKHIFTPCASFANNRNPINRWAVPAPTGLWPLKAQGCEERATLGHRPPNITNPNGVVAISFPRLAHAVEHNLVEVVWLVRFLTQRSGVAATLGWRPMP